MPQLDVSEILDDIDFYEGGLMCLRQRQMIGSGGLAANTQIPIPFGGVVTQVAGSDLKRDAVGEVITGSILIVTRFRLIDGKAGFSADVVKRGTRSYTVANVLPYSKYGAGFVEATCDLLPLAGSAPVLPGYPPNDHNE
jgi:galactose-6-phosphate isomerase